jgi:outer membrane lipoprotein SlyB
MVTNCFHREKNLTSSLVRPVDTRKERRHAVWCILILGGLLCGCAAKRPVLYPNHHLTLVGSQGAEADIDACMELARGYGAGASAGGEIAKDTTTGAAVGGATGAAVGAVLGNFGKGAAAGAAGGAAGALTRGVIRSGDPDPTFRRFVEKCLRDKGYEPIGWQ